MKGCNRKEARLLLRCIRRKRGEKLNEEEMGLEMLKMLMKALGKGEDSSYAGNTEL